MNNKRFSIFKTLTRSAVALALVAFLVLSQAGSALAARSGGGFGGGSFRRAAPTRMMPSRPAPGPGYRTPYGGGFGFPFMLPFFFGGGGTLFSILIFIAIANFLVSNFRNVASSEGGVLGNGQASANPPVSISTLQVGLLAEARSLQTELDKIALNANTESSIGLTIALQETTLALLRHPEYWVYGNTEGQQTQLLSAEAEFNRRALSERSKFAEETLTQYDGQVRQKSATATLAPSAGGDLLAQGPGEYIVVSLIVAAQGKLKLPTIQSTEDLKKALNQIGAIASDDLLAMRVLWTPQADGDTLTADDVVAAYPQLRRL